MNKHGLQFDIQINPAPSASQPDNSPSKNDLKGTVDKSDIRAKLQEKGGFIRNQKEHDQRYDKSADTNSRHRSASSPHSTAPDDDDLIRQRQRRSDRVEDVRPKEERFSLFEMSKDGRAKEPASSGPEIQIQPARTAQAETPQTQPTNSREQTASRSEGPAPFSPFTQPAGPVLQNQPSVFQAEPFRPQTPPVMQEGRSIISDRERSTGAEAQIPPVQQGIANPVRITIPDGPVRQPEQIRTQPGLQIQPAPDTGSAPLFYLKDTPPAAAESPFAARQREQHRINQAASDIYQAMKGGATGFGTDEMRVFKALEGRDPQQISRIREAYQEHYGRNLDRDVLSELRDQKRYIERVKPLLDGDTPRSEAAALKLEIALPIKRREEIFRHLENKTPPELKNLQERFFKEYNTELRDALPQKLSGPELERAVTILEGRFQEGKAIEIRERLSNLKEAAKIPELLATLTPQELRELQEAYLQRYQKTLREDLTLRLEPGVKDKSLALLDGNPVKADAIDIRTAIGEKKDILPVVREALEGLPPSERQAILAAYREMYRSDMSADLQTVLSGKPAEAAVVSSIIGSGSLTPAEKIIFELQSIDLRNQKLPMQETLAILRDQSGGEVQATQAEFRHKYGADIFTAFRDKLTPDQRFELKLGLLGKPETLEDEAHLARIRYERERADRTAFAKKAVDLFTEQGKNLDDHAKRIEAQHKRLRQDRLVDDEQEEVKFYNFLDFFETDLKNYQHAKARLASMASNTFSTFLGILGFVLGGRSGQPLSISIAMAVIIGGIAKFSSHGYLRSRGAFSEKTGEEILSRRKKSRSRRSRRLANNLSRYQPRRKGLSKVRRSAYKKRRTYNGNFW